MTTPITVGTETNDCSDLKANIFTRALASLSLCVSLGRGMTTNSKQTINMQATRRAKGLSRGREGRSEGGGRRRVAAHVFTVINNPTRFDSCDPQLARIDFVSHAARDLR